ncbi:Ribosomal proteins 50S-L18Ae/60S-L20/60S-L18A [uncultured archaeon]|jgi:large subunit ribosomal protein LX|nr:Ribosomal proteins 50S-L18Ae/60S-L20/60S-L18A [uncultured archaeon]
MMFEIKGRLKGGIVGKDWNPFTKVVESHSEKNAIEKTYSLMGSKHGLKRNLIKIDGVKTVE